MTAQGAAVGLKQPVERRFQGIESIHTPEVDGSAKRALCGEELQADHEPGSGSTASTEAAPGGFGVVR